MSSAMARGSATQPPELTPERAVLLKVKAFALDQVRALGVSPQRESGAAPPLAVSRDGAAETLSRSQNTETGLPARVHIGDEVSPLTNDTSIPVSTENSGSLHHSHTKQVAHETGVLIVLHAPARRALDARARGRGCDPNHTRALPSLGGGWAPPGQLIRGLPIE